MVCLKYFLNLIDLQQLCRKQVACRLVFTRGFAAEAEVVHVTMLANPVTRALKLQKTQDLANIIFIFQVL